jgi:hypothetical protein
MPDVYSLNSISNADEMRGRILPLRKSAELRNSWLKERLETVLPQLMIEEGFDMWVVIAREYNEDPVLLSLLPDPEFNASRRTLLVFTRKEDGTLERLNVYKFGLGDFYKGSWDPRKEDQWQALSRIIIERDPKRIGINVSETWAFGDGLSHTEHSQLKRCLPQKYVERLVSAERLCIRWLETRTPVELSVYPGIVELTHTIISEAFSSRVIHPGITTTDDVQWWMRQKMLDLGLYVWFPPTVDLQGPPAQSKYKNDEKATDALEASPATLLSGKPMERKLILQGDLLHCDIGFIYLGLATDVQRNAYILKPGETDAPEGLSTALRMGNRLQDIHAEEMLLGRTGNEMLNIILTRAKAEGINPSVYSHPIGIHGHGAGPIIGLWDQQNGVPARGDLILRDNTCYSIELNIKTQVPEWGGDEVRMLLEEDAAYTGGKLWWLSGRQTKLILI